MSNEITIYRDEERAEERLAKLCAQLLREGIAFTVREDIGRSVGALTTVWTYTIHLTGY